MSAPENMWLSATEMLVGREKARMIFGHNKSALGYVFRPFTYTYQHILDHYYKHPKQQISSVGPADLEPPEVFPFDSTTNSTDPQPASGANDSVHPVHTAQPKPVQENQFHLSAPLHQCCTGCPIANTGCC